MKCGSKIELQPVNTVHKTEAAPATETKSQPLPLQEQGDSFVDEKLKKVEFYYSLSVDKKEDINLQEEPVYFLKAQDLLVDLSQQYPDDYRVWWELCKPLDFHSPLSGADLYGRLTFNEGYFNKALDLATLDKKKELIDAHDQYLSDKRAVAIQLKLGRVEWTASQAKQQILQRILRKS